MLAELRLRHHRQTLARRVRTTVAAIAAIIAAVLAPVVAPVTASMTVSIDEGRFNVIKGGPVSEAGKVVVRWNATRHGIRSPAPVVPGVEKKENWEEHRASVLESFSPFG